MLKSSFSSLYSMERFFSLLFSSHRFLSILELGRPWNGVVTGVIGVLGMYVAMAGPVELASALLVFLAFTSAYIGGATINDLFDKRIDFVNMPYRPIQTGRVTEADAWRFAVLFHLLALLFAALAGPPIVATVVLFFLFSGFYSLPPVRLVEKGYLAQLDLAFTVCFIPLLGGAAFVKNNFDFSIDFLLTNVLFTLLFGFIFLIKDFKDVIGDRVGGKKTPVVTSGPETTRAVMMTGTLIMFSISTASFYYFLKNNLLLYLSAAILLLIFLFQREAIRAPERAFSATRILLFTYILFVLAGFARVL